MEESSGMGKNFCDMVLSSPLRAEAMGSGVESSGMGALGEFSPVVKELKLVLEVCGVAGLTCDGQERKLLDVLGQVVAAKRGCAAGEVRSNHSFNEV